MNATKNLSVTMAIQVDDASYSYRIIARYPVYKSHRTLDTREFSLGERAVKTKNR